MQEEEKVKRKSRWLIFIAGIIVGILIAQEVVHQEVEKYCNKKIDEVIKRIENSSNAS